MFKPIFTLSLFNSTIIFYISAVLSPNYTMSSVNLRYSPSILIPFDSHLNLRKTDYKHDVNSFGEWCLPGKHLSLGGMVQNPDV